MDIRSVIWDFIPNSSKLIDQNKKKEFTFNRFVFKKQSSKEKQCEKLIWVFVFSRIWKAKLCNNTVWHPLNKSEREFFLNHSSVNLNKERIESSLKLLSFWVDCVLLVGLAAVLLFWFLLYWACSVVCPIYWTYTHSHTHIHTHGPGIIGALVAFWTTFGLLSIIHSCNCVGLSYWFVLQHNAHRTRFCVVIVVWVNKAFRLLVAKIQQLISIHWI